MTLRSSPLRAMLAFMASCALAVQAAESGPPLPPLLPAEPHAPAPVQTVPFKPVPLAHSHTPAPPAAQQPPLDSFLAWDAATKEATVTNGTIEAHFAFALTNISQAPVKILNLHTSCGCTAAQLPAQPWELAPGTNGEIRVTMNVAGKVGTIIKTVTVTSDKGAKTLFVKTTILPPAANDPMVGMDRVANQKLALADRQAVFKGDCASCHAAPAIGQMGHALFNAACGVCHEAEHRASMVPDLHALKQETNAEYWRNWVTQGKPGTLMPAFAESEGGILTAAQIESLVDYLTKTIPSKPATAAQSAASESHTTTVH